MIYLDNNATTAIEPEVVEAMMKDLSELAKNPSSVTKLGRQAKLELIEARATCAKHLSCKPQEIIFTSGASEANNLAIFSMAKRFKGTIVTSPIEHPAILEPIRALEKEQRAVYYLKIDERGHIDPSELLELDNIAFVALGAANSETGVLSPLETISNILNTLKIPLMIDAVGQFSRAPLNLETLEFHALTLSGHKIHGPKGSGLAIFKKFKPTPEIYGGSQESGIRGGTENLPAILGLAKAIEMVKQNENQRLKKMQALTEYLETKIKEIDPQIECNGSGKKVVNTRNLYFPNHDGQTLLINLDQNNCIASMGSACSAAALEPSHVIQNMYPNQTNRAHKSLRFSISYKTTQNEIDTALQTLQALLSTNTAPF